MSIFDVLKSTAKVLKEANKIEQYQQILEVQQQLLDMQDKIQVLTQENQNLKELRNKKKNLIVRAEVYFLKNEDGTEDGPFCTNCYDVNEKLVRMQDCYSGSKLCPNCQKVFRCN